jgi:hypothetical protein
MTGCVPCGRNFHEECEKGCKKCHGKKKGEAASLLFEKTDKSVSGNDTVGTPSSSSRKSKVRDLKDEKSTGRKRAARLYPISKDDPCEWMGLKNCGGGRRPVVGCYDGRQQERHHGPVKKTTRNEEGNVHRICEPCHIHWHELNDLIYDEREYNSLPHDPITASPEEIFKNRLMWESGEMGRKFELASSKNHQKFRERQLQESDS